MQRKLNLRKRRMTAILLAAAMTVSLPAFAEGTEETAIYPPCNTTLYYSVGTIMFRLDEQLSYSTISVYRSQQEGNFLYYQYDAGIAEDCCVYFPLIEGDYVVMLTIPADNEKGTQTFTFYCTIGDPDMDETLSFDSTEYEITLSCDPASASNVTVETDEGIVERVARTAISLTIAGNGFQLGDLNDDGYADAADAAYVLMDAARVGAGSPSEFGALQHREADLSLDDQYDAADAAMILIYSARFASGEFDGSIYEFIQQ